MTRRIREGELRKAALKEFAQAPGGFMTTSDLIDALQVQLQPAGTDAALLLNRNDNHFSQKVRNLVSHRADRYGLEARGLAIYDSVREGWTITDLGRQFA